MARKEAVATPRPVDSLIALAARAVKALVAFTALLAIPAAFTLTRALDFFKSPLSSERSPSILTIRVSITSAMFH